MVATTNKDYDIIVVGDIHGDLNQLLYPLKEYLDNKDNTKIVFLGDYIDRGDSNVYICAIIKYIIEHPSKFPNCIFIRGNHEESKFSTYDNIATNTDRSITTFTYDLIHELPLHTTHYDEKYNVLFSHSKLQRSLDEISRINKLKNCYEYCITEDPDSDVSYTNIHGHDHKGDLSTMRSFSKTNAISMDVDASYAFREILEEPTIYTNLTYMVITNVGRNKVINKKIYLDSPEDFNDKTFSEICTYLNFPKISLSPFTNLFRKCYRNRFRKDYNMEHVVDKIRKLHYKNTTKRSFDGSNIYFHDIPYEIYREIGITSLPKLSTKKLYSHIIKSPTIDYPKQSKNPMLLSIIILILIIIVIFLLILNEKEDNNYNNNNNSSNSIHIPVGGI